jgi:cellulose synthase/poly-beta-1,6-N-acetylglucosamine synthase-like glycosyltransferase
MMAGGHMAQWVFWGSIFLVVYPYAVYPLLMAVLSLIRPRPARWSAWEPRVSVLISAYNEVAFIGATVRDKLAQDYPADKLQVIVVSDCSSDGTDEIVRDIPGVVLLRTPQRGGKSVAINLAVLEATGELLVFSDANTLFQAGAIRRMAGNFADPDVGYVTGELTFGAETETTSAVGIGAYLRYEDTLRRLESRCGSMVSANGGIDCIRRTLYVDVPAHLSTDFVLPLSVIERGRRVVFDPDVRATEMANTELGAEFNMRVRVALPSLQAMLATPRLFNPLRHPLAAFCLVSHKALRYAGFVFMLLALASNILLAFGSPTYRVLLEVHVALYAVALLGLFDGLRLPGPLRLLTVVPAYLVMSSTAFAVATFRLLRGRRIATWQPRAG